MSDERPGPRPPSPVPQLTDPGGLLTALRGLARHGPRLSLVVDECRTMRVWQPAVRELHGLAAQAFGGEHVHRVQLQTIEDGDRPEAELAVIVTDGLDEIWRQPFAHRLLSRWGGLVPVAIVNPYPQGRWSRTHLAPRPVRLTARHPRAPNTGLHVAEDERWRSPLHEPLTGSPLAVPLLELDPRWLGWWATLVGRAGEAVLDATVLLVAEEPSGTEPPAPPVAGVWEPARAVAVFRGTASERALRLASYVAAAPPDLAAVRVVQGGMMPASTPLDLADVVVSDALMEPGTPAAYRGDFRFRPGVREALLARTTRVETARVVEIVARHYGDRRPEAQSLLRALEKPETVRDTPVTLETVAFAETEVAVLRALSGPYLVRARQRARALDNFHRSGSAATPAGTRTHAGSSGTMSNLSPDRPVQPIDQSLTMPGEQTAAGNTVWGSLPPRNGDFIGRNQLLEALERRLRAEHVTAVLPQALHGLGGVGKSQIAVEYAYRHRDEYDIVWWIPAEQPAQILRAILALGEKLGLEVEGEASTAVVDVWNALQTGASYPKWLLIFDNAETVDTVQPYLPREGSGKVLITSRNERWTDLAQTLEIDVFSRAESVELLRKRNPQLTPEEADRIAEVLEDLPLAVGQASAWLSAAGIGFEEYLRLLLEKREQLAERATAGDYDLAVAAAWTVALDRLGVESPAALQLLQVCAFFAPEPIARELFVASRNSPIAPELDATLQNPSRLNRALRQIQRYGLARIDHRDQTVQLHRLVRTVMVDQLSQEVRGRLEHGAHVLLAGGNPGNPSSAAHWPRYHALLPHVEASNTVACEDAWTRQLVLDVIGFYYWWGDQASCRDLARRVVTGWRTMLGPDDLQTLKAARWLAYVQRLLGEFAEAAQINEDCLARLRATVGEDEEDTLDAMSLVAADLRAKGDFEAARTLDRTALDRCRDVLGDDDPFTLKAAHSLAVSLRLTGEYEEALRLDRETFRRRVEVLGEDHLETLMTRTGLALDLRERGDYLDAHTNLEGLYDECLRHLDPDHPQVLAVARNLAVARRRAGDQEGARKLAEETMTRLRQRFTALQPEAIAAAIDYAVDLRESDNLEAARELSEATANDYGRTLGPDHPYTLYARTNLAIVLRLQGDAAGAHAHDEAAYRRLAERLGEDHVLTLTCATNLASDLAELGEHRRAYELDATTLRLSRERLGADHPSTLACALNLSFDLAALGRAAEADRLYEEVLAAMRRVLGSDHPAIDAAVARVRANCDVDPMPL